VDLRDDKLLHEVALRLFEGLAGPRALKAAEMLRAGDYDGLASCKIDPRHYSFAESYWRDAMAISFLRKCEDLDTSVDRKVVAEETFLACERECLRTNQRLFPYLNPSLYGDAEEGVTRFLARARKEIGAILGRCPDTHWTYNTREGGEDFVVKGRFGPGATYGDRGLLTTIPDKMSSRPTITPDAKFFQIPWMDTLWAKACKSSGRKVEYVPGNRFTTVPKDCLKNRGIAVEPSLNLFYQLGYGRVIRHRLLKGGIDLPRGQDIHRVKAREASIMGHLATLDLSNASDTVSRILVKLLLPLDWFDVLNQLRSKKTEFRGGWHVLEKFSSMGNGFTFELETLIFLGLILALSDPPQGERPVLEAGVNVFVFGDDIIVPTEYSKDVVRCLSFFGMSVNESKSFVDGPFRESCGGDYFQGVDVRPFFLGEFPSEPQQLISLANGLRLACKGLPSRSNAIRHAWDSVVSAIPSRIRRCRGPEGLGDLCLHDDESRWRFRWRSGIRHFDVYQPLHRKVRWNNWKREVVLASAIYGQSSGENWRLPHPGEKGAYDSAGYLSRERRDSSGVIPRGPASGYKIGQAAWS